MTRKEKIQATVTDLIAYFLYYDRKEDEDLPLGEIENAIKEGEISLYDISVLFKKELFKGCGFKTARQLLIEAGHLFLMEEDNFDHRVVISTTVDISEDLRNRVEKSITYFDGPTEVIWEIMPNNKPENDDSN